MKHVKQGIHENRRAPFEMKLDSEVETESTQEMPTSSKDYDKRNVQQRSKKKLCSESMASYAVLNMLHPDTEASMFGTITCPWD